MTAALAPAPPTHHGTGKLLSALIVGGVTAILDTTIIAIALQTLVVRLDAPISTIQWVSTGYLLSLAIAIPFVGWAQARYGGKRLWLFALTLFMLGSVLCASAWDAPSLIAFRLLQGLGAGIMFPLMQTLAMQNIDPARRTRVMATVALPAALGPILGPVLGGLVLHALDWRWLFLINVPLGVAGLILAALFLPRDRPAQGPTPRLDAVGALLVIPALAGLLFGLSRVHEAGGIARADVLVPAIAGALLLAAFVGWAWRRAGAALINLRLLAVRSVRASSLTLTFLGASLFAGTFLLPLFFQQLQGASVLRSALLLIPQGVGSLLSRFVAGALIDAVGARRVAVGGFLVIAAATVPFALAGAGTGTLVLSIALFVRGLGLGVVMIPVMTVAYVDIAAEQMPHASAITRIVQQLGGAFGTASVAVVLTLSISAGPGSGFAAAFWCTIGLTVAAAVVAIALPGRQADC